jgi:hypothetical protein
LCWDSRYADCGGDAGVGVDGSCVEESGAEWGCGLCDAEVALDKLGLNVMRNAPIAELVQKKTFLISAFLHSASLPSGGGPDSTLKHAVTGHFLQAVMLELIIKAFYELDLRKAAPFNHDIATLFQQLTQGTKNFLNLRFDEARERQKRQFVGIDDIKFHSLQEVLSNNEKTVKNFKYDAMGAGSNSSADGEFYREVLQSIQAKVETA